MRILNWCCTDIDMKQHNTLDTTNCTCRHKQCKYTVWCVWTSVCATCLIGHLITMEASMLPRLKCFLCFLILSTFNQTWSQGSVEFLVRFNIKKVFYFPSLSEKKTKVGSMWISCIFHHINPSHTFHLKFGHHTLDFLLIMTSIQLFHFNFW